MLSQDKIDVITCLLGIAVFSTLLIRLIMQNVFLRKQSSTAHTNSIGCLIAATLLKSETAAFADNSEKVINAATETAKVNMDLHDHYLKRLMVNHLWIFFLMVAISLMIAYVIAVVFY